MCTRLAPLIIIVLLLVSLASGATVHWTGAGGDRLWSNPNNWEGKKVPTAVDEVYIDVPAAVEGKGPIIQNGIDAKIVGLACEVAGEPTMTMTGGTLEIGDWIWWGDGDRSHGTFTMSGGAITVVNEHELGWGGGSGTWIMTGGTVSAGRLVIPTATGAAGQLYLRGGTYQVGAGGLTMTAKGLIDITEGTLLLEGDKSTTVQGFISGGQIRAYNGKGYLDLDYDVRNPGMTTVTAVPITGNAYKPEPADGARGVMYPLLKWAPGLDAVAHDLYLGTSPEGLAPMGRQPVPTYWHMPGLAPGATYYWRVDETALDGTVYTGDVWSFTAAPATAFDPRPWNDAKWVDPEVVLGWTGGMNASSHDVYFGTDKAAVQTGDPSAFKANQVLATYDPGTLVKDTVYYWRIDERVAGGVVHQGEVWSFRTIGPGGGVKAQYFGGMIPAGVPVLTQIEDSINHTWGTGVVAATLSDKVSARWIADLEAPLTETYTLITTSDDGVRLWLDDWLGINNWTDHSTTDNRARVDLIAGQVYLIRMEWYDNTQGAVAQLSWQSPSIPRQIIPGGPLQLPVRATGPYPACRALNTPQSLQLRWLAAAGAAQHEIYFGDDEQAVAAATNPVAVQSLNEVTYDSGSLEWNKTYYWRVDEVNAASADSPWKGSIWSFTTADFVVVDDFESYTDEVGERIFQTWLDGFGYTEPKVVAGNGTGATVGHTEAPFAEQKVVHTGRQAMPLDYNNAASPYYSETERTWPAAQNWTLNGVDTLVLYVRGTPANSAGQLYVVVQDNAGHIAVVTNADPAAVTSATWLEWKIPLNSFGPVNPAGVKKMYVGVGNRTAPAKGGVGSLYIDDIRVVKTATGQ